MTTGRAGHGGLTVIPNDPTDIQGMIPDSIALRGPAGPEGIQPAEGKPLTEESLKEIDRIIAIYPRKGSALLPALWVAQHEQGFVGLHAMRQIGAKIGVAPAFVAGVVSFYTMYQIRPGGKYLIQVCTSLACYLRGSDQLVNHLKKKLNVDLGGTTKDKKFTLTRVECLGSCDTGPMFQVNDKEYHESLSPLEKADKILDALE